MVVNEIVVDGYEELMNKDKELNGIGQNIKQPKFVFLTGSKLPETGKSWCPDCVKAEPVVREALNDKRLAATGDITFITCSVGHRDYWKNPSNPFKTDEQLKVSCIPTLLQLNSNSRCLNEEEDFANVENIVNFLSTSQ